MDSFEENRHHIRPTMSIMTMVTTPSITVKYICNISMINLERLRRLPPKNRGLITTEFTCEQLETDTRDWHSAIPPNYITSTDGTRAAPCFLTNHGSHYSMQMAVQPCTDVPVSILPVHVFYSL